MNCSDILFDLRVNFFFKFPFFVEMKGGQRLNFGLPILDLECNSKKCCHATHNIVGNHFLNLKSNGCSEEVGSLQM